MQRPIHRLGILSIILLSSFVLTNCGGGGGGSASPPPPPAGPTGAPEPPASVIATAVSGTQVTISWSSVSDATSYSVYRSAQTGTAYTYTVVAGTAATIVSDTTVTSGTPYYYVVTGTNSFGEGTRSVEVSATPAAPSGTLTITGTIKYEDKEYDQYVGHTGTTSFKAVRFAEVELVNDANSAVLWSTATSSTGVYSISTSTNTGTTVYVRVLSTAAPINANTVSVKNLDATPALYAVKTASFALSGDASVNLSIPASSTADGAFNALDVFTSGYEFVNTYAGTSPPALSAYWQPNSSYGTYFCPLVTPDSDCIRGRGIYIYSNYDTDEFDDDVLWHEFGHFIGDTFSKDDSPGGTHYLDDNTQDLRLSWSEGWGSFFPIAVKFWLNANTPELLSTDSVKTPPHQYIDTVTGGIYLTVNIGFPETDACSGDDCRYATNEISNANVLWAVMNGAGLGMAKIWDVVDNYLPGVSHPVNIEDFWDGWFVRHGGGDLVNMQIAFATTRLIDYSVDSYESDDALGSAPTFTVNTPQAHRIYGDGDVDYVMFSVPTTTAQYTISTGTLRNGADTYLTLFDNTGTMITWDDNATTPPSPTPNTTTALSSRIVRNLGPGDYYVSVRSAPSKPVSAGRYGSYTLTITTP